MADTVRFMGASHFKSKLMTDYTIKINKFDQRNCFTKHTHAEFSSDHSIREKQVNIIYAIVLELACNCDDFEEACASKASLSAFYVTQVKKLSAQQIKDYLLV